MFIFASSRDPGSGMQQQQPPSTAAAGRRNNRYTRSSTTSVTQLLSDSCSSLLQRLTNRVRGPSTVSDRSQVAPSTYRLPSTSSSVVSSPRSHHRQRQPPPTLREEPVGTARSRLEEKYSSILDRKPSFRRREISPSNFIREERTLEPSMRRSVIKSPVANKVLLSEKAYPYVTSPPRREKTPCGHERRAHRPRRNAEGSATGYSSSLFLSLTAPRSFFF